MKLSFNKFRLQEFIIYLPIIIFAVINIAFVYSNGMCAADDAINAMTAKLLADGKGYALPGFIFGYGTSTTLFPCEIATGVPMVTPVALCLAIFGVSDLVPGIVSIAIWSLLLGLCIRLLRKILSLANTLLFSAGFVLFGFLLLINHLPQWFTLLGEVTAALMILLSVIILYLTGPEKKFLCLAGALFGLAFLTKIIVIFSAPGIALILYKIQRRELFSRRIKSFLHTSIWYFSSAAILAFLFELWKLLTLGFNGYLMNLRQMWLLSSTMGITSDAEGLFARLISRLGILVEQFPIIVPLLSLLLVVIIFKKRIACKFVLSSWLTYPAAFLLLYWTFLSLAWPRHTIIALLLLLFSFLLLVVQLKGSWAFITALVALVVSFVLTHNTVINNCKYFFDNGLFSISSRRIERQQVVESLERNKKAGERFITQWWATGLDILFCMNGFPDFFSKNEPEGKREEDEILVLNRHFLVKDGKYYNGEDYWTSFLHQGSPLFAGKHYLAIRKAKDQIFLRKNLVLGEEYSFSSNSATDLQEVISFGHGWHSAEEYGRWVGSREANIYFNIETEKDTAEFTFSLDVYPFTIPGKLEQEIKIKVNGVEVFSDTKVRQQKYAFTVPASVLGINPQKMTILAPNIARPSVMIAGHQDGRCLGIAIKSLTIR